MITLQRFFVFRAFFVWTFSTAPKASHRAPLEIEHCGRFQDLDDLKRFGHFRETLEVDSTSSLPPGKLILVGLVDLKQEHNLGHSWLQAQNFEEARKAT